MDVRVGPERKLSAEELMLLNCGVQENPLALESPLDCKEIKPVSPKRISSEYSLEGLMLKLKLQYFGHLTLIRKDADAGKDWRQEQKGTTEDEMVGWHHRLNGHGFEQAPGAGVGQGSLACCSPWGCKELDTTEQLNWTEVRYDYGVIFNITTRGRGFLEMRFLFVFKSWFDLPPMYPQDRWLLLCRKGSPFSEWGASVTSSWKLPLIDLMFLGNKDCRQNVFCHSLSSGYLLNTW